MLTALPKQTEVFANSDREGANPVYAVALFALETRSNGGLSVDFYAITNFGQRLKLGTEPNEWHLS